jgi:hypothetical protein
MMNNIHNFNPFSTQAPLFYFIPFGFIIFIEFFSLGSAAAVAAAVAAADHQCNSCPFIFPLICQTFKWHRSTLLHLKLLPSFLPADPNFPMTFFLRKNWATPMTDIAIPSHSLLTS